jgi:membrane-bound inhibitor of C-type lysozyme
MSARFIAAAVTASLLLPDAALATQTSLELTITTQSGEFEQRVVRYDCAAEAFTRVVYLNAAPNFLAIVPLADEPEPMVMAAVISGSGARYAAGKWVWWTKGAEAALYDATMPEDAEPVLTCTEVNDIP